MSRIDEMTHVALIGGRPARYRIRRSDRARRVSMRVTSDDGLVVVMPRRCGLSDAGRILAEFDKWIARQLERYGVREGPVRRAVATGRELLVLGEPRRLELAPLPDGRRRARIDMQDGTLSALLAGPDLLDPRPAIERWLRALAREVIVGRVLDLWPQVGRTPRKVIIGDRSTRWGSCSPSGVLSFCYRLVMAPLPVIDSIVLHELCHLPHHDHGPRFQALLTRLCPEHRRHRAWLRAHEGELRL